MNNILKIRNITTQRHAGFRLTIPRLTVNAGTSLCITGPNGSGKTTLLEHITGLLAPSTGNIFVQGSPVSQNLATVKAKIGYIPDDEMWFIPELCATEYFDVIRGVYESADVHTDMRANTSYLSKQLGFTAFNQPLRSLSHGNKKKVQIIAGLMHEPALIVVDELRNGLDPIAIMEAENLLQAQLNKGCCVIAATHDLWWAERFGDEILLLINGSIAIHNTAKSIIQKHGSLESLFKEKMGHN